MHANRLNTLTASEIAERTVLDTRTVEGVVDKALANANVSAELNVFITLDEKLARKSAEQAVALVKGAEQVLLAGVPVAVKDNIATLALPTTCGSRILGGYVSPYEATAVRKLKDAGAVIFGKTNLDEFGMGSSTEHSAFGPTLNPHAFDRVPGGSSGGSAAAVAQGIVSVALGSDTGGSVRQPAAFCGVVGVKPTYGRVSRFGLVAFASSLDCVGVLGGCVDDAARGLAAISGHDQLDATSSTAPIQKYWNAHGRSVKGLVIGKPKEYFTESLDPAIAARCDHALDHLKELGAEVREVSLPHTALAIPAYYIIAPAEASANLSRFDGVRYGVRGAADSLAGMYEATRSSGFGTEVIRRILLGTYALSAGYYDAYYKKAQQVRTLIAQDFSAVFASGVNALFTPTTPTTAFKIGAVADAFEMYLSDVFTVTANLAGVPAMSVPIGTIGGLPVGGQIISPHFDEYTMFSIGYALERVLDNESRA